MQEQSIQFHTCSSCCLPAAMQALPQCLLYSSWLTRSLLSWVAALHKVRATEAGTTCRELLLLANLVITKLGLQVERKQCALRVMLFRMHWLPFHK